jgi:hypothetical protein
MLAKAIFKQLFTGMGLEEASQHKAKRKDIEV